VQEFPCPHFFPANSTVLMRTCHGCHFAWEVFPGFPLTYTESNDLLDSQSPS
jgi:hypothetical protein